MSQTTAAPVVQPSASTSPESAGRALQTQVYRIYIKAPAQSIWDAITQPDWTEKYGYGGRTTFDLRPGGAMTSIADEEMQSYGMPECLLTGEVIESDPPHRLVQTWKAMWNDDAPTRLTYEIAETDAGVCELTLTHVVEEGSDTAAMVAGKVENAGGGWAMVLSDIKTLLETGQAMRS